MEFRCILKAIKPELGSSLLWCLFIGTVVMLALACGGNRQSVDDDLYLGTRHSAESEVSDSWACT